MQPQLYDAMACSCDSAAVLAATQQALPLLQGFFAAAVLAFFIRDRTKLMLAVLGVILLRDSMYWSGWVFICVSVLLVDFLQDAMYSLKRFTRMKRIRKLAQDKARTGAGFHP